jgi:hypothetical protein
VEVFVHSRGKDVELVEVQERTVVRELVEKVGVVDGEVWLEETDETVEIDVALIDAGITDRSNVHVGTCKKVTASVRYQTQTKGYEVPPATTLQSIFARATSDGEGFGLSEVDRAQYTLQVQGTNEQPDLSRHVGSFVDDHCSVTFDLVLQDRFQG